MDENMILSDEHFVGEFWLVGTGESRSLVADMLPMSRADHSEDFQIIRAPSSIKLAVWSDFQARHDIEDDVKQVIASTLPDDWPHGSVAYYLFLGRWTLAVDKCLEDEQEILSGIRSTFNIDPARCLVTYV